MSEEELDRERARIRATYGEPEDDPDHEEGDIEAAGTAPIEAPQRFHVRLKGRNYSVDRAPIGDAMVVYSDGANGSRKIYPPRRGTRAGQVVYDAIREAQRQKSST